MTDADEPARATLRVGDPAGTGAGAAELEVGTVVGHFMILGRLGEGGMGVVYTAYDHQLDRKVAIKVLHAGATDPAQVRLAREAQAMAKLTHANVVTVYEVGVLAGRTFIAMELVTGATLRAWLAAERRSSRDILDVFVQAGRGLAAAHRAGIIHRDFKPDNVLIDHDGRARVTDFGVAKLLADTSVEPAAVVVGSPSPLTATGAFVGTLAYMSPEQLAGEAVDARSDQFAVAVALEEALTGVHPLSGEGQGKRRVPSWILKTLVRARERDPARRYPSLDVLLDTLQRGPVRRRRIVVAVIAAVAAAVVVVTVVMTRQPAELCGGARERLAGVWDPSVKEATRGSFVATKRAYATAVYGHVEPVLDRYADAWVAMRTDACEATAVRQDQSAELLDLRMQCLDRRRDALAALTAVFAKEPDPRVLDRAVVATSELEPLTGCADAAVLTAAFPPPSDPGIRTQIASLRVRLDRGQALVAAGRGKDALELARAAVDDARHVAYPPVLAEALLLLGNLEKEAVPKQAEATLKAALAAAATAHDDTRMAQALTELVWFVGYSMHRPDEARALRAPADAAIVKAGDPPVIRANLLFNLGSVENSAGAFGDALRFHREALAIRERVFGVDHPIVARSLNNVGTLLSVTGKFAEAQVTLERALGIGIRGLAPTHPFVGSVLGNLGNLAEQQGHYAEAADYHRRALSIFEQNLGLDHPNVAAALLNLGNAQFGLRRFADAAASQERALAIRKKAFGEDSAEVAAAMSILAATYPRVDRFADAIALAQRSAALREKLLGAEHPDLAWTLDNLGGLYLDHGDAAHALPPLQRALAIREKAYEANNVRVAESRVHLADCYLQLDDATHAAALTDSVLAVLAKSGDEPHEVARASFVLAQALTKLGRDPARAQRLADEAHRLLAAITDGDVDLLAKIDGWRELHQRRR